VRLVVIHLLPAAFTSVRPEKSSSFPPSFFVFSFFSLTNSLVVLDSLSPPLQGDWDPQVPSEKNPSAGSFPRLPPFARMKVFRGSPLLLVAGLIFLFFSRNALISFVCRALCAVEVMLRPSAFIPSLFELQEFSRIFVPNLADSLLQPLPLFKFPTAPALILFPLVVPPLSVGPIFFIPHLPKVSYFFSGMHSSTRIFGWCPFFWFPLAKRDAGLKSFLPPLTQRDFLLLPVPSKPPGCLSCA